MTKINFIVIAKNGHDIDISNVVHNKEKVGVLMKNITYYTRGWSDANLVEFSDVDSALKTLLSERINIFIAIDIVI